MKSYYSFVALLLVCIQHSVVAGEIKSYLIETSANELVLYQEVVINSPVEQVWNAYTTVEGCMVGRRRSQG